LVLALLCLGVFFVRPAHAYLDPGAGSYAAQIALAGMVGGLFALRAFWAGLCARVGALLGGRRPNHTKSES
jgi:hypothetical protein